MTNNPRRPPIHRITELILEGFNTRAILVKLTAEGYRTDGFPYLKISTLRAVLSEARAAGHQIPPLKRGRGGRSVYS